MSQSSNLIRFTLLASAAYAMAPGSALAQASGTIGADITGPYRLIFITGGHYQATSGSITTYNEDVTFDAANQFGITQTVSTSWVALASTDTTNAVANANSLCTGPTAAACMSAPIYQAEVINGAIQDVEVATSLSALFGGTIVNNIAAGQDGTTSYGSQPIWTGTLDNGQSATAANNFGNDWTLGSSVATTGSPGLTAAPSEQADFYASAAATTGTPGPSHVLYGISGVLTGASSSTIVPEPASAGVLAMGAGVLCVMRRRRRAA